jgi:hypothetical protein
MEQQELRYTGEVATQDVLSEWTSDLEQSFHDFMDEQPKMTCCFGMCNDGVNRHEA